MNRDLIKKNRKKYYTIANKGQGQNAGGYGNKNKKRSQDRKKKDTNPVSSQHKKGLAAGIQLFDTVFKVICKACDLNSAHSSCFHVVWTSNKSCSCLPAFHSFVIEKVRLASDNHALAVTPSSVPESSSNKLTFSRAELKAKIVDAEQDSTDPNAGLMA